MTIAFASVLEDVRTTHHTQKYKSEGLIVRRGFPVALETEATSLTIRLVPAHPQNSAELGYEFTVSADEPANNWSLDSDGGGSATLHIPPNAVVGMYAVEDGENKVAMAVLFNAFCEEDGVYMEDGDERNEYVMNDVGRIWVGAHESPSGIPWSFGQFRVTSLLCAIHFLDSMAVEDRQNPILVTRHLSAVLNAQDDNGVLSGRWDGEYSDGVSPSAWTGSAEILKQYWESLSPVRYGQCWVFSGLFTAVMRALGVPARTVTNFVSAHDTTKPYNRAVDKYYSSDGDPQEDKSYDSIWNFHVWNSAWMVRPDMQEESEKHGLEYSGWQVLDATPQETSDGLYQLGPVPLIAVKHGYSIGPFPDDIDFVVGEVNADVVHYWETEEGSGEYEVRGKHSRHVGQKISTKAVGKDGRNDVTLDYKFEEGTEEERASLEGRISGEVVPEKETPTDVAFEVAYEPECKVGAPLNFEVKATNNSEEELTVVLNCLYRATDYTGTPKARIGKDKERLSLPPGESGSLVIEVLPEQYEPYLAGGVQTIQFNSSAKVRQSDQVWSYESIVRLNADDTLLLNAPETVEVENGLAATAVITNISNMPLTGVVLRAEGEGLLEMTKFELEPIDPGVTVEATIEFTATEIGDRLLVTTLDTAEMKDISRSCHIIVTDSQGEVCEGQQMWQGQGQQEALDQMVDIQSRGM